MYYYAIVNDYCQCTGVQSSSTVITDDHYVEITEEQFTSQSVVGQWWNTSDRMWDTVRYFSGTSYDIDYKGTGRILTYKLNEMDEAIANHSHTGYADADHTHTGYAAANHSHSGYATTAQLSSVETAVSGKADASAIPTKTSQLTNDSGFKTTDNNTTYSLSKSGSTITLTGSDGSTTSVTDSDNNTTYGTATSTALGLVKVGFAESGKNYPVELNSNGQMFVNVPWSDTNTDTNTTYSLSKSGSTITLTGSDGSTTSVTDADTNTVYTHPTYTAKSAGLYKVAVDGTGHVSGATAVTKADITALGIPAQDTTYTLGSFGVTATAAELNKMDGVTATTAELNYCDGVTSNIQTQLNGKAASSHTHSDYAAASHTHDYAASSHTHSYLPLSGGTVSGDLIVTGLIKAGSQQAFYYNTSANTQTIGTNNATGGTNIAGGADSTCSVAGALLKTATVIPRSTNTYYCGNANYRWKGIYSAAAVNVSSDERLKENIKPINEDEAVKLINDIDVKSFNYIGNDEKQIGVIAQDILKISPELAEALVTKGEDGYYGVKTSDLVFPLLVAVQKLTKRIEELENR